jgi:hypothetical protein
MPPGGSTGKSAFELALCAISDIESGRAWRASARARRRRPPSLEAAARRSDRPDRLHGSVAWIPAVSVSLLLSTDAGAAPPPLGRRRALAPRPIRSSEACRASRSRAPGAGLDPSRATRAPRAEQTWPGTARSRQQPSTSYAADATCGAPPLARLREAGELRPQQGREGCGDQSADVVVAYDPRRRSAGR